MRSSPFSAAQGISAMDCGKGSPDVTQIYLETISFKPSNNKWFKFLLFSEAEYTYKLRKTVVPLRLENKYNPDGWLGIMIGTKLWFDFSVQNKFEASLQGLIKEIRSMQGTGGIVVILICRGKKKKATLGTQCRPVKIV